MDISLIVATTRKCGLYGVSKILQYFDRQIPAKTLLDMFKKWAGVLL